ncbi:phospho-sugar mutase [Cytophagaceae bacterium YF14B1]|uniref:Phospho-sugar mutase n=1 Tax=Xanthocytophaga flava TaxID=3048013 RepID=A0AAE3QX92_9BACT|nr:phospho-sugar mutase [Xanthocytophaga flavus]MDJ1472654.1 phospho-sugar mutase [Xanthocytophaga flavus]MDJ1485113.1 phospho-sugar mutase [Xanthocytophaga flavus]
METAIRQKIDTWLSGNYDADTKAYLNKLLTDNNDAELNDAFYKDLEFGTGGLRGTIGIGTNRMNQYTVGMATQGLANYLKQTYPNEEIRVAIAHDSRIKSDTFAQITADVFSANGIKVFLFPELRPTPELSFAVRELKCHSGVVITASHNPKEYNGYKAYWNDGGQVIAPHDKNIIGEVQKIKSVDEVKFAGNPDLIVKIGPELDEKYRKMILGNVVFPDVIQRQKAMKIVFTPIHGTGITQVPQVLELMGFTNVHVIEEQAKPDGTFPTVVYPNPEEKEAMSLALKKAAELDADLILATDPDSDRVGIGVKNHHGKWQLLNGNQTGSLIIYYLLQAWKQAGKITGKEFVAKTIVTTDLIDKMAADYGVECPNVLTGFKYIAAKIKAYEGEKKFIAGGEESYGYLVGDAVRDKDAIASCAIIAELVAYAKDKGISLFDMMREMYAKYGFYYETLISLTKKGQSGAEEIKQMMNNMRNNPPKTVAGSPLVRLLDYELGQDRDLINGTTKPTELEKSDVLQFITADGTKVSARPSGTEPKIKFYVSVNEPLENKEDFDAVFEKLKGKVASIVEELKLS